MKTLRTTAVALAAAGLLGAVPARAADPPAPGKEARADAGEVRPLNGIGWYRDLDAALKAARKASPARPVCLLRVLGNLDGGC